MIKHNKKRNTHLLYEFMVRHIAQLIIDNQDPAPMTRLVNKYFNSKSIMQEEYKLFEAVLNCRKDRNIILRVLSEIKKFTNKIDYGKLDLEKTTLISEVKKLGYNNMYDHRVENYKLCASIQLFINNSRNKNINESVDGIHLEENIVNLILNSDSNVAASKYIGKQPNFHFITMIDSITEDLKNLPQSQRDVVLEFIDRNDFSFVDEKLNKNKIEIGKYCKNFGEETNKKINVFIKKFNEVKELRDKFVLLVESQELIDELRKE
ncbi:MAG: hypothetical protein WC460_06795 [Patescibacteria group bacterium]